MAGEFTNPASFSGGTTNLPSFQPVQSSGPRIEVQAPMRPGVTPLDKQNIMQQAAVNQRTIDAITKMGNSIIEPAIKQEQQELFLQGAQRQMQGEALTDIVNSQPWYSKIFGPSASAQGARKMAELTNVDTVVNGMASDMSNLRQLAPDEFQAELRNRTQNALTGDAEADTTIQMQILESSQALIKAHTKEHYAYTQEQMQAQYTNGALANAEQLQQGAKALARGTLSKDEYDALRWKVSASLQPLEGQNEQSYFDSVHSAGIEAMQQGNWHYVKLLEETGIVSSMPSKMRQQWREEKRQEESKGLSDLALGDYHMQLASISAQSQAGRISPNQVLAAVKNMNEEVAKSTGIERPFLSGKEVESLIQGNLTGIYRAQEKAQDRAIATAEKKQELLEQQRLVMMGIASGNSGNLTAAGVLKGTDVQAAANTMIEDSINKGNNNWLGWTINNFNQSGAKFNVIGTAMQAGLRASQGEDYNPLWQRSMDIYKALNEAPGGQAAASAYAGDDAGKMQEAYESIKAGMPPELAYKHVFQRPRSVDVPATDRKDIMAILHDKFEPTRGFGWLSDKEWLTDQQKAVIGDLVYEPMKQYRGSSMSAEEQFNRAWPSVATRVDLLGKAAVRKQPDQPTLAAQLKVTQQEASQVFDKVMTAQLKAAGMSDPNSVDVTMTTYDGQPVYFVEAYKDGQFKYMTFKTEDFQSQLNKKIQAEQNAARGAAEADRQRRRYLQSTSPWG